MSAASPAGTGQATPAGDLVSTATALALARLPVGTIVADGDGRVVFATPRVAEILGTAEGALATVDGVARLRWYRADGRRLHPGEWPLRRVLAPAAGAIEEELTVVRPDGTPVAVRVTAMRVAGAATDEGGEGGTVGSGGGAVALLADVTAEHREREARTYLAEAAALLGGSVDVDETAARLARLAVPRIADWCSVELLEPDGSLRQAALAHANPAHLGLARELRLRRPPDPSDPAGLHAVVRSGQPVLVPEIPPSVIEDPRLDERERELVRSLGLRSLLMIPLVAGERPIGALNLVTAMSGRRLGPDDLALAEALGSRAAATIQHARLFDELRRFRAALDATHEAVVIADGPGHRITYANRAAGTLFGDAPAALAGRPIEALAGAGRRALRSAVRAVAARPGSGRRVTVRAGQQGHGRPVELSLQALGPGESAGRVVAIGRDITERIAAAERMRRLVAGQRARAAELDAVIRAIGDGLVVVDAGGRIRLANPAADRLLPGLDGATWAALAGRLEGWPGDLPPGADAVDGVELRRRGPDECWIELSCYPVAATDDTAARGDCIVVLRDVTDEHRRRLVRETFLGVLSHELRTPVTTIYGAAKLLARPGVRSKARDELFADIADESERLQRLVENVIALQRFGEDGGELGREPVLLQRILPAAVGAEQARWPGVTFALDLAAGLPTVAADPIYLEQVVRNLLGNAAKYAGSTGPVMTVARAVGDEVVVRILDRGPGVAAEEAGRLFELYYRSPATADRAAGAGIGLFVCSRLIGAMGGRIWARPRAGGGAEFGFALRRMVDG